MIKKLLTIAAALLLSTTTVSAQTIIAGDSVIKGTSSQSLYLGGKVGGYIYYNKATGKFELRDSTLNIYKCLQVATPLADNDAATKNYVDTHTPTITKTNLTTSTTGLKVTGGTDAVVSTGGSTVNTDTGYGIPTTIKMGNWDSAYGWGDHAGLYSPIALKTTLDALNGIVIGDGAGNYTTTTNNSTNWDSAYGWGDHAGLYSPIALKTTLDALNGIVIGDGAGNYTTTANNSTNWDDAYGWGDWSTSVNNILDGTTSFTNLNVDNLNLNGNTLSSTDTNGNINLTANGTGEVIAGNAAETTYLIKEFAELYVYGGSGTLTLTNQNTWYLIDLDTDKGGYDGVKRGGITQDKANSKITITRAGYYRLIYSFSIGVNYNESLNLEMSLYKNGAILPNTVSRAGVPGTSNTLIFVSYSLVSLAANDYIQPYIRNVTNAGKQILTTNAHFSVEEI